MSGERIVRPYPGDVAGGRALVIPTVTLFDGTENLRILSAASVSCVLAIYLRMRRDDGTVEPMQFTHTPNSDRSAKITDHAIGAGTMLHLTIVPQSGAPLNGECFVQASIIRGFGGATLPQGVLAADYTTVRQPVSWPGSPIRRSTDGNGVLVSLGPHTQASQVLTVTVPSGARWRINSLAARLNTIPDGVPGDRVVLMAILDGSTGQNRYLFYSPFGQPQGVLWHYIYLPSVAPMNQSTNSNIILTGPGPVTLRASDQIIMVCAGVYEGLETLSIDAMVEEWLEVAA